MKEPNFGSTCYRLKAKINRNLTQENLVRLSSTRALRNKSRLPDDADFAVVYFYRPKNFYGSAIGYKIRLEDMT